MLEIKVKNYYDLKWFVIVTNLKFIFARLSAVLQRSRKKNNNIFNTGRKAAVSEEGWRVNVAPKCLLRLDLAGWKQPSGTSETVALLKEIEWGQAFKKEAVAFVWKCYMHRKQQFIDFRIGKKTFKHWMTILRENKNSIRDSWLLISNIFTVFIRVNWLSCSIITHAQIHSETDQVRVWNDLLVLYPNSKINVPFTLE